MVEDAARRLIDGATDDEKAALPKFEGESWVELYRHLLLLRSKLTFNQLIGFHIEHSDSDASTVRGTGNGWAAAICSEHIMRAGKHYARFPQVQSSSSSGGGRVFGLIRPIQGWDRKGLGEFKPTLVGHRRALLQERTTLWGDSSIHQLIFREVDGRAWQSDFAGEPSQLHWQSRNDYQTSARTVTGFLLDLDNGTLAVSKDGLRIGVVTNSLSGVYSWMVWSKGHKEFSIERGPERLLVEHAIN